MGRLCYPTQAPPQICPGRPESCHGARRVRRSFCRPGTSFIDHYACRGTMLIDVTELSRCNKCYKRALAQCRGTSYLEARKLSRCRIYIADRCACLGARTITKLSWEQEQNKNCDEQLTHIVRVSVSC